MKSPKKLRQQVALAMMLGVVGFFHSAYALPQIDGAAPAGVTIASEGSTMNIGSSAANNVLNWKTFSIGESEKVAFDAQNYLNLVTGTEASSILGQLTGGGSVYLINPNGILFGANAKVDVGAFYASTRNIDAVNTTAFAASGTNPLLTTVSGVGGDIINRGNIAANQIVLEGGHISIQNYENIQNSAGEILNSEAVQLRAAESGGIHVGWQVGDVATEVNNSQYYYGSHADGKPTFAYKATTLDGSTANNAILFALVHNIYELQNIKNLDQWAANKGYNHFMLAGDIDGTGFAFQAIDSLKSANDYDIQRARLDGLGYTIKNLNVEAVADNSKNYGAGIFGTLHRATVENLNIEGGTFKAVQVDGSVGYRNAGSIAGAADGDVVLRNVHSSAAVSNGRHAGGFIGINSGNLTIEDSSFTGSVNGSMNVGGLVGSSSGDKTTIKNSYNTGTVAYDTTNASLSDRLHMGGLVGYASGGLSLVNTYNTGTIDGSNVTSTGFNQYAGGLAGYVYQSRNKDNYTIEKSYNTGDVELSGKTENIYAGGLFGYYQNDSDKALTVSETYNAGKVIAANSKDGGKSYAGGLIGYVKVDGSPDGEAFTLTNSYASNLLGGGNLPVTISGGTSSGGLVGYIDSASGKVTLSDSYWYSTTIATYGARSSDDVVVNTSGLLDYYSALANYKSDSDENPNPHAITTYTARGWDISNNGGEDTVWRIFNLHTPPMLRTFLKPKSVAANVTVTKEYNGTAQSVNYSDLNALGIYGDTTGSLGNTTFGSQTNAGTAVIGYNDNSPNSLSALTWSGQDGVDYDDINFTITPKNVSVSFANPTKEYDGTATASIANPTLTGLISSDSGSVSVSAASAAYDSKNAGTGKIVTYTGLTLAGDKAANYSLTNNVVKGTGTITQKTLNANLEAISKVYDGTTNAAVLTPTLSGVVDGDSVSVTASGSYDSKNVGSRTVNYTLNLSGTDAANYSLSGTTTGAGTITLRPVILTAEATEIIRGEAIPELTGSASNMVAGEPAPTWSTTADSSSRSGQYPIIGALDSSIAGNYEVTQASGNAIALTIKVNPDIPEGPTPEEPTIIPTEPKEIAGVMADRSIYRNNPVNVGQEAAVVAAKESSTPASPQAAATSVTSGENTSVMTVTEETGTTEVKDNADSEKNK